MKTQEVFSQRLRKLRKERKMSQRELAQALNLSDVSVSRYELGAAQPSIETIQTLCNLFGVTSDYLIGTTDMLPVKPSRLMDITEIDNHENNFTPTQANNMKDNVIAKNMLKPIENNMESNVKEYLNKPQNMINILLDKLSYEEQEEILSHIYRILAAKDILEKGDYSHEKY